MIKNKMEILHAALSSQMDDYDFDYDEAFANILKDLTKTEDVPPPESLKGVLCVHIRNADLSGSIQILKRLWLLYGG